MATAIRELQLRAELPSLGIHLDREARGAEARGEPQELTIVLVTEAHQQDLGRRAPRLQAPQLVERGQEAVHAEGGAHSGETLLRVEAREVVVAATRAAAADRGQVVEGRLEHDPRVVVEATRDGDIELQTVRMGAASNGPLQHGRQALDPGGAEFGAFDERRQRIQDRGVVPLETCQCQDLPSGRGGDPGLGLHLGGHLLGPDLVQLVERPQQRHCLLHEVETLQEAGEDLAVVHVDRERPDLQPLEELVDHEQGLHVRERALGPDRVEVALNELAVAPALGVLTAPDWAHVVALERRPEAGDVLSSEAREGDRQVEPERDVTPTVVREAIHLLVGLVPPLAEQHLRVLEGGRVDRREAEGAIDLTSRVDQPLARDHAGGDVVAEALERPRLDQLRHGEYGVPGAEEVRPGRTG